MQLQRKDTLDLGKGLNVDGLDVILELEHLLLKHISGDLVILDDSGNTDLVDTIADGDELRGTPEETVHLNGADSLLEGLEVSLIIPGLDVKGDHGLGNDSGLLGLLGGVLSKTLLTDAGSLGILLLVGGTEEVHVILILISGLDNKGKLREGLLVTGEGGAGSLVVSGDLTVPPAKVGVLLGGRGGDGLEDDGVSLGGGGAGGEGKKGRWRRERERKYREKGRKEQSSVNV